MDELDDGFMGDIEKLASLVAQREPPQATLGRIVEFSTSAIEGSSRLALSVIANGRPVAVAASDETVHTAETLQYELGEGPALTAIAARATAVSRSLGGDATWPRFGSTVARRGLHSVLAVPMLLPDAVVGAICVYVTHKDAFDAEAIDRAQRYAIPATAVVHNMHLLHQSRIQIERLSQALTSRSVIDQAIGIIRSRNGGTAADAFDRLRRISNTDRVKLVDLAAQVVERSVRRARARQDTGE
ncbi:MAG: GAF and ANTAR domain-containing protein [Jatrophihabitantaceae bacterium]